MSTVNSYLKILNLNIGGLARKLENVEFINYIKKYDLICFTETQAPKGFEINVMNGFKMFSSPAKKLSKEGHLIGGVIVLIRNCFESFFEKIDVAYNSFLVLDMSKDLLRLDKNVVCLFVYIPHKDSPVYLYTDQGKGPELIENCLVDVFNRKDDFYVFMCGDFNARTGQENGKETTHTVATSGDNDCVFERASRDTIVNGFGKQLISICDAFDCSILNGIKTFRFDDGLTFISNKGCSTIDYYIMSNELCRGYFLSDLIIDDQCVESDHLPVVLSIYLHGHTEDKQCKQTAQSIEKCVWDSSLIPVYLDALGSTPINEQLRQAKTLVHSDINKALEVFVTCLQDASGCMIKKIKTGGFKHGKKWFDQECFKKRKLTRASLRKFRRTQKEEDRICFVQNRKEYNVLKRIKKQNFYRQKVDYLAINVNNTKIFWKEVRGFLRKDRQHDTGNKISTNDWYEHFKRVFNSDSSCADSEIRDSNECLFPDILCLDSPISVEEVTASIMKLKHGKSSGNDGILAEMIKAGQGLLTDFLTEYFNKIFTNGYYPDMWSTAVIVPIHKKGNRDITDNYRGVSLLSIVGKIYTSILNSRLYSWLEDNEKITESQAGFRQGYSATDHIFTLYSVTQKYLSRTGVKLYVAFVDLKKAFDSVKHKTLLAALHSTGVSNTFTNAIKAMYTRMASCVRANGELSEFFECPQGLRQGCVLSPTLFSVIINEIACCVSEEGKHGVQLLPGLIELFILLFADDLALISCTPHGLQTQLDCMFQSCTQLGLSVNTDKTKIMVFRKGGFLSRHEKWQLGGNPLEVVNQYVYLGYTFTTTMSINESTTSLASKGKRALYDVIRIHKQFNGMDRKSFFKIFDTKIQPIVTYASEVWGILDKNTNAEKIHMFACKKFLNVSDRTPNTMVLGELGRYPLFINCYMKAFKYWLRLLKMSNVRLPRQAYTMLMTMDSNGKENWASKIRSTLQQLGFGFVWLTQGVGTERAFLSLLKQRLTDVYSQEWLENLQSSERFNSYSLFKDILSPEIYLEVIEQKRSKDILTKFRLGLTELKVHKNRYSKNRENENNDCSFCPGSREDERHLVFKCHKYDSIRPTIMKNIPHYAEQSQLVKLMKCQDTGTLRKIAWFILKSFEIRKAATALIEIVN